MPKIAAGATNKNISIAPHGTGKVVVGTGAADATLQSDGDFNLVLQTGNSTTGKIEIEDGANGNIDITPNGTGEVDISKVDIDGGAVDGVTLGTNSAVTEAQIDNINIDGNAITSTNTNGNIDLTPAGTGEVNISKVDIDGGAIDATDVTVGSGKTLDVSAGSLTTSTAQKQAIIDGATLPASLPSQTGNAEKILKTSGSAASWVATRKLLASTDGIQRSDGTAVLSEDASNVATLNNVVMGGSVTGLPTNNLVKTANVKLGTDVTKTGAASSFFTPTFVVDGGASNTTTIYCFLRYYVLTVSSGGAGAFRFKTSISGTYITDVDYYDPDMSYVPGVSTTFTRLVDAVTLDGNASAGGTTLTYQFIFDPDSSYPTNSITVAGDGTCAKTWVCFYEMET